MHHKTRWHISMTQLRRFHIFLSLCGLQLGKLSRRNWDVRIYEDTVTSQKNCYLYSTLYVDRNEKTFFFSEDV